MPRYSLLTNAITASLVVWLSGVASAQARSSDQNASDQGTTDQNTTDQNWFDEQKKRLDGLRKRGIIFHAGTVVSGSGIAAGVELRRDYLAGPIGASITGMWSIRGYHAYDLRVGRIVAANDHFSLRPADGNLTSSFSDDGGNTPGTSVYVHIRHRVYPRMDYFGMGRDAARDTRSDFSLTGTSADLVGQWQLTPAIGIAARTGLLDLDVSRGTNPGVPDLQDVFDTVRAPGFDRRDRFFTAGGAIALDTRREPGAPTGGRFLSIAVWKFVPLDGARESITRVVAEARSFHSIAGPRHVLALRALAGRTTGDQSTVPFFLQQTLGGAQTLRGLSSYRFRGAALLHGSAEYRWHALKFLEVAPFIDIGAASSTFGGTSSNEIAVTPGIGLRFRTSKQVLGRLDFATGRDGRRVLFTIGAPF